MTFEPLRFTVYFNWQNEQPATPPSIKSVKTTSNEIRMPSPADDEESELGDVGIRPSTTREPSVVFVSASQKDRSLPDAKAGGQPSMHIDLTGGDSLVYDRTSDQVTASESQHIENHDSDSEPPEIENIVKSSRGGPTSSGTYRAPDYSSDEEAMEITQETPTTTEIKKLIIDHAEQQLPPRPTETVDSLNSEQTNVISDDARNRAELIMDSAGMEDPPLSAVEETSASKRDNVAMNHEDAIEYDEYENRYSCESSSITSVDISSESDSDSSALEEDSDDEDPDEMVAESIPPVSRTSLQPPSSPSFRHYMSDNEDRYVDYVKGVQGEAPSTLTQARPFHPAGMQATVNNDHSEEFSRRNDLRNPTLFPQQFLPRHPDTWLTAPWIEPQSPAIDVTSDDDDDDDDIPDHTNYPPRSFVHHRDHGASPLMSQARENSPSDIALAKPITSACSRFKDQDHDRMNQFLPTSMFHSTLPGNFVEGNTMYPKSVYPDLGYHAPNEPDGAFVYTQGPFINRGALTVDSETKLVQPVPLPQVPQGSYLDADPLPDMGIRRWTSPFPSQDLHTSPEPRTHVTRPSRVPISEIVNEIPNDDSSATSDPQAGGFRNHETVQIDRPVRHEPDLDCQPRVAKRKADEITCDDTDSLEARKQDASSLDIGYNNEETQPSKLQDVQPRGTLVSIDANDFGTSQSYTPQSTASDQSSSQGMAKPQYPGYRTGIIRFLSESASNERGEPQHKKMKFNKNKGVPSTPSGSSLRSFATGCIAGAVTVVGTLAAIIATVPMSVKDDAWNTP